MTRTPGKPIVAKETLRSNIKNYIQQQIAEGVYHPGDRIVETKLAKELGVSQAPVREAMLELSSCGLLEERPYSGTFVRNLSIAEIEDIFEIRAYVEDYAARRAAKKATEEQLATMEAVLNEMNEKKDLISFVHLDMDFHSLVMEAAGSPALTRAWKNLRMAEWTYLCAAITETSIDEMIDQHWTIFRYLKDRAELKAGAYMFLHISGFGSELASYFEQQKQEATDAVPQ